MVALGVDTVVDDSVGLAIRLENRYKGLRSPHKIVCGFYCNFVECAEAQSKDFGIIATDKGWNSTSVVTAVCALAMVTFSLPTLMKPPCCNTSTALDGTHVPQIAYSAHRQGDGKTLKY
ncbi:hypothetical protein O9929_23545 [Vibrio lentus]|nr:hypothetical protein [Vibrio lentus]